MLNSISEKSYAAESRYANFYIGGDLAWSGDGQHLFCQNSTEVTKVNVSTGQVDQTFSTSDSGEGKQKPDNDEVEADNVYSFAVSLEYLVTAHKSGLLRLWSLDTGRVLKLWKAQHRGPIVKVAFSSCGNYICSSGADGSLRVWQYAQNHCIAVLKDCVGPALLIEFHPKASTKQIFAAGADNVIYCWNFEQKTLLHRLKGHISQVTAFAFAADHDDRLVSVGRDKVLIEWQLAQSQEAKQLRVIPIYEEMVGVYYSQPNAEKALVACANGSLKQVTLQNSQIANVVVQEHCELKQMQQCLDKKQLAVVTAEQNIFIYSEGMQCLKQLIGFNDEILDLCYMGADDRYLAVATNSKNIKIYDTQNSMNCKVLAAHKETVMSLSAAGNLLLSAGKDNSILLWQLSVTAEADYQLQCVAQNINSHTSTVGCIAFAHENFQVFASVCQDGSLKVWTLKKQQDSYVFNIKYSALAHAKEVNCVVFAPNNKLLATASQDKLCKLWSADSQALIGTLRGHTRGVWCVRFSPVDQIVLTSSADCSLRLWSLGNFACLKRFEQECSVLKAEFLDHGKFIISAASDGLLKLWNIKTNACIQTLDEHNDRVWSLAVSAQTQKHFYSGAADSKIIRWQDVTKIIRNEEIDKRQAVLQQEQLLQSLLQQKKNQKKAFVLALKLGKPRVSYNIVSQLIRERNEQTVQQIVDELSDTQKQTLLEHVKIWSTNSRQCQVSNLILRHLLSQLLIEANPSHNTQQLVEVLTPYIQRHFKRLHELQKDLCFLEFIVQCI